MDHDSGPVAASHDDGTGESIHWGWVLIGISVGAVLLATFVPIAAPPAPRRDVGLLVGALTLMLTGIVVGYKSPGSTIREAGIVGAVLTLLAGILLWWGAAYYMGLPALLASAVAGPLIATAGGWVGEVLQGTVKEDPTAIEEREFRWPWVAVGILIGLILSNYSVLMLQALFGVSTAQTLIAFAGSFLLMGFFVGFSSPGVTVAEPAVAGVGLVLLNALLILAGFQTPLPRWVAIVAVIGGLLLAFLGSWLGEMVQTARHPQPSPGET